MATYTITGKMKVDYISKQSGRHVVGSNIYVAEPIKSDYGEGVICNKLYVSEINIPYADIKLQKCEGFSYDKYGNVKEIQY